MVFPVLQVFRRDGNRTLITALEHIGVSLVRQPYSGTAGRGKILPGCSHIPVKDVFAVPASLALRAEDGQFHRLCQPLFKHQDISCLIGFAGFRLPDKDHGAFRKRTAHGGPVRHGQLVIAMENEQSCSDTQDQQDGQADAEAFPSVGTSHSLHFPKQLFISGMIDLHPYLLCPVFRNNPDADAYRKNDQNICRIYHDEYISFVFSFQVFSKCGTLVCRQLKTRRDPSLLVEKVYHTFGGSRYPIQKLGQ